MKRPWHIAVERISPTRWVGVIIDHESNATVYRSPPCDSPDLARDFAKGTMVILSGGSQCQA